MLNLLIVINWIVIGLVGSAMVYSLVLAVYDLVADVKRSRALQANSDLYHQLLLDDVYYRDSYAELFSQLAWRVERETTEIDASSAESVRNLLVVVNQFIDDSKVVR